MKARSFYIQLSLLALFLFNIADVAQCNETCELEDVNCTTRAANSSIMQLVRKVPLSPLYEDNVKGQVSTLMYHFKHVFMFGLKKCDVTELLFNTNNKTNELVLKCESFMFTLIYKVNGSIGDAQLDNQKGALALITDQFQITILANYTEKTKDKKTYLLIHVIDIKAKAEGDVKIIRDFVMTDKKSGRKATMNLNGKNQSLGRELVEKLVEQMMPGFTDPLTKYLATHSTNETLAKD